MKTKWAEFSTLKKALFILLGFVVFSGLMGVFFGEKTTTSTNSPSETVNTVENLLNTSENKTGCFGFRDKMEANGSVILDWTKQAATDSDLAVAFKNLGDEFAALSTFTTGEIQTELTTAGQAYKQARVSLLAGDTTTLLANVTTATTATEQLKTLCASIGK
jgi:hypothetical protein